MGAHAALERELRGAMVIFRMPESLWVLWVTVAVVSMAGEVLSLSLFFASIALSAAITAAASVVLPLPLQIVLFCIVSLIVLFAVRPSVLRVLPVSGPANEAPAIGPTGRRAIVSNEISALPGQIRTGVGEFWSARAEEAGASIPRGTEVEIIGMEGLTAIVRPFSVPPALPATDSGNSGAVPFGLTAREITVLQLVARGLSNAEIAGQLVLSQRTVDHHLSHILHKMGAESRMEAVRIGMERGIVALQTPPQEEPRQ